MSENKIAETNESEQETKQEKEPETSIIDANENINVNAPVNENENINLNATVNENENKKQNENENENQNEHINETVTENETSTINENKNNDFDGLTSRFDEISNESYSILNTLKSKMNEVNKMHEQFNETGTTFNNISNECKLLLNAMNGIKTEMMDKSLINMDKYNMDIMNEAIFANKKYSKTYLKTLSKSELIDIIVLIQHNESDKTKSKHKSHPHSHSHSHKKRDRYENNLKKRHAHHKETSTGKMFADPHEKVITNIKATERIPTDYEKIERQRATIKALKEKKKLEKSQIDNYNQLKQRNAHRTNNLFADPHEKIPKLKELKRKKSNKSQRNKEKEHNNTNVKEKTTDVTSKKEIDALVDTYAESKQTYENNHHQTDYSDLNMDIFTLENEFDDDDDAIFLESELLKLNMKMLKKRCKEYRVSAQGGKLEMIAKILQQEQNMKQNGEQIAHDEFTKETNVLSGQ